MQPWVRGLHLVEETYSQKIPKVDSVRKDSKGGWCFSNKHNENQ